MPQHRETKHFPYTPAQMFALVIDIERYPDFLPWCHRAVLRERRADRLTADLYVGTKKFQDSFTSHVTFEQDKAISVSYGGGPLTHLETQWRFTPHPDGGSEISFEVNFALKSKLLGLLMDQFFDLAFLKMLAAFEKRAQTLYS